jgi:hypothetical protein
MPAAPSAATAAAAAAPGQRMSGPLRPVNPFMVQDPKQKARRLARALVSDLVVYHPEKRQQGLRDHTLPQLFKDEIEKSWQEYVEQVGADIARNTPFWTEALNEILGGGNKVF